MQAHIRASSRLVPVFGVGRVGPDSTLRFFTDRARACVGGAPVLSGAQRRHSMQAVVGYVVSSVFIAGVLACSDISGGSPCGRNQHASGSVTLPDTGINAGRAIQIAFIQHDPDLAGELSEVVVQQTWPAGASPDSEPDPRVRLLSAAGQVFLDTLGTRFDQPSGRASRPTWYVLHWIKDAVSRNGLYEAFAGQSLWLELWLSGAAGPGTRVRVTTQEFGVNPPVVCL